MKRKPQIGENFPEKHQILTRNQGFSTRTLFLPSSLGVFFSGGSVHCSVRPWADWQCTRALGSRKSDRCSMCLTL